MVEGEEKAISKPDAIVVTIRQSLFFDYPRNEANTWLTLGYFKLS